MKTDRLRAVLALIEQHPAQFDYSTFYSGTDWWDGGAMYNDLTRHCGTAGCVGGWTTALSATDPTFHPEAGMGLSEKAAAYLECTDDQATYLFFGGVLEWSERPDARHLWAASPASEVVAAIRAWIGNDYNERHPT